MTSINSTNMMTQNLQNTMQSSQAQKSATDITGKKFQDELGAKKAAKEFEAMYLGQMLNNMVSNLPTDGYFGGGNSEEIYRSMMVTEYGNMIAEKGGIGLADQVYREIIQMQQGEK